MIYTLLYVFFSTCFSIIVHVVGNSMHPVLLIFLCAINTMIFFHLINISALKIIYSQLLKQNKLLVFSMMITIALSTIGSFLVPIYYRPAEFLFAYIGGITLLGSINSCIKNKSTANMVQIGMLVILLGLFYVMIYYSFAFLDYLIFISVTTLVSIVTYIYFVLSYKLFQYGLSSVSVLTIRFWPLVLGSGAWSLEKHYFDELSVFIFLKTFMISILLLILPVFLSQKSIEKAGPNIHAIFMGFIPFFTLTGDVIFLKQHQLNNGTIIFWVLSLVLVIIITTSRIIDIIQAKSKQKVS